MAIVDLLTTSRLGIVILTVCLLYAGHWLSEGIWVRWKFRQLKAMGIVRIPSIRVADSHLAELTRGFLFDSR